MNVADNPPQFYIYNASAGSGKTFLLVQRYLEIILRGSSKRHFQRTLALTFTNKAVFEMKWRILNYLNSFGTLSIEMLTQDPMAKNLLNTLEISPADLARRSQQVLHHILHDYGAFDVITLDSFTHRIIRSFAKELGLRSNFNVTLGVELMLRNTVEDMVNLVGNDNDITNILTQFTYARMDEGSKNWDLKESLYESSQLILNENHREAFMHMAQLDNAEQEEYFQKITSQHNQLNQSLIALGEKAISLCHDHGLEKKDFSYGTLYNRFKNLALGNFKEVEKTSFLEKLQEGKGLYPKTLDTAKKEQIDALLSSFLALYTEATKKYYRLMLIDDIRKQWVPLSLLSQMAKRLEERQVEENQLLLSSFNERIAKEILRYPVPYIFERLGERYRDYFIDEFQDTSRLQWENLIPLIENTLVSEDEQGEKGSLLLVGDPKQSIYRWRGGDVDQFIALLNQKSPFLVQQQIKHLETNYRSAKEIVSFNNSLMQYLQGYLNYSESKKVYATAIQSDSEAAAGGFVQLSFLPSDPETNKPAYAQMLVDQIIKCKAQGYPYNAMAVLVRKRKQAEEVATFLSAAKLPLVSSDALKVAQSDQVAFLVYTLQMFLYPNERQYKKEHLTFLYATQERSKTLHQYLKVHLAMKIDKVWEKEGIQFHLTSVEQNTVFTLLESICFTFPGIEVTSPFVQNVLDSAFDFCQNGASSLPAFIDYWEKEGQLASLSMSEAANGVRILTIHQAKGLEFPVVFFPYVDDLIHPFHRKRIWLDTHQYLGKEFPLAWVNFSKRVEYYGTSGKAAYHTIRTEEEIDAWNTLYVAVTRPVEALYIYTTAEEAKPNSFPHFFHSFVKHHDLNLVDNSVTWGTPNTQGQQQKKPSLSSADFTVDFDRYAFEKKLILPPSQTLSQQESIDYGNLVHDLMAEIQYADDCPSVLHNAWRQGRISSATKNILSGMLNQLLHHPQLSMFFTRKFKVLNEQDIMTHKGEIIRPDRIVYSSEESIVIDYKTGESDNKHEDQITTYCQEVFAVMKRPVKGYLVYLPKHKKEEIRVSSVTIIE